MERLGVDFDEVIVYCVNSFLKFFNEKQGTEYSSQNLPSYQWFEGMHPFTNEEVFAVYDKFIEEKITPCPEGGAMPLVEGAEEGLSKLVQRYDLHLITTRPSYLQSHTYAVLKNLGNGQLFRPENVHFTTHRYPYGAAHYGKNVNAKALFCKELQIGKLIDDNADIAASCAGEGIEVILFEKPWNKNAEPHPLIHRKKDWKEICEHLLR